MQAAACVLVEVVGYVHRRLINTMRICTIWTIVTMIQAACPGQGCYALMRLFLKFHKVRCLSCSTDGAFKVKGSSCDQLALRWANH